jgi:putative Ca2+/H+ antiporter (TMEM165/GDT1 family)
LPQSITLLKCFLQFLRAVTNFAIVIVVGQLLTEIVPIDAISLVASVAFIAFGVWTVREEEVKEGNVKVSRFGIVATVGIAFFVAELGYKKQLATLSLGVQYQNPSVFQSVQPSDGSCRRNRRRHQRCIL